MKGLRLYWQVPHCQISTPYCGVLLTDDQPERLSPDALAVRLAKKCGRRTSLQHGNRNNKGDCHASIHFANLHELAPTLPAVSRVFGDRHLP